MQWIVLSSLNIKMVQVFSVDQFVSPHVNYNREPVMYKQLKR